MAYVGWELPENDRRRLLAKFPPHYPDIIAHHVTLYLGVGSLPSETHGFVVGVADDGNGVQALVIEIGGDTTRPDGSTYHITWSIDRSIGAKPVHSNVVVKRGWTTTERIAVSLVPKQF